MCQGVLSDGKRALCTNPTNDPCFPHEKAMLNRVQIYVRQIHTHTQRHAYLKDLVSGPQPASNPRNTPCATTPCTPCQEKEGYHHTEIAAIVPSKKSTATLRMQRQLIKR